VLFQTETQQRLPTVGHAQARGFAAIEMKIVLRTGGQSEYMPALMSS
jgi:hypothetical protein